MTALRFRLARPWASERSLTALLILLLVDLVIVYPLSTAGIIGNLGFGIGFGLVLVSGIAATARNTIVLIVFTAIAVASTAVHWIRYADPTPTLQVLDIAGSLISVAMLAVVVSAQVFREGEVTHHRLRGAVAVYLLLAATWALAYALVVWFDPDAFHAARVPNPIEVDHHRYLYFSFVTLTTLGFGDIVPVSPLARLLVIIEGVVGQLFPAILLARLVSLELYHRQRRFEREQAALDREALTRELARELGKRRVDDTD